jgi:integrase
MIVEMDYLFTDGSGVWFYRRRFLKDIRPFVPKVGRDGWGRELFKRSLHTKDMKAPGALERFTAARLEYEEIVVEAEKRKRACEKRAARQFDDLDSADIATLAARYHAQELGDDAERRKSPEAKAVAQQVTGMMQQAGFELPTVPEAAEWTLSIREAHETIRAAARSARAIGDIEGIVTYWGDKALSLASLQGRELKPGGSSHIALCEALHDAEIRASEDALRRMDGDDVPTPAPPALPQQTTDAPPVAGRTLGHLIDAFKADRADKWSKSATNNFVPVERVMREVLGSDLLLSDITRERGRELFETVKRLPKGLGTLPSLRGVSVTEAIEMGLPGLSPKSINGTYLSNMKAIFKFALQEHWIAAHPMLGLTVHDPVHDADKRDPFTAGQLQKLFSAAPWSPRDEAPRGKPLHYWGPLIALFLGMRRGEIAQLLVSDIVEVAGVSVILIKSGGGRRVKTKNSRRMLPVHPELIRLGFLRYVGQRRKARGGQLWEGEVPNGNDQWGDGFSDWFLRLLNGNSISGNRLGLHSLRHNFQDALREAELHGTGIGQELAGRAGGGDTSNNYGSRYSTRQLADAVAKVAYPGLVIA